MKTTNIAMLPNVVDFVRLHTVDFVRTFALVKNNHNYKWHDVTAGSIEDTYSLRIRATTAWDAVESLYVIYRHTDAEIERCGCCAVTEAQYDSLIVAAERWQKPALAEHVNVVADDSDRVTPIGYWTGINAGEGMYIGIEPDGHAHS